jgi:hypothetical protein
LRVQIELACDVGIEVGAAFGIGIESLRVSFGWTSAGRVRSRLPPQRLQRGPRLKSTCGRRVHSCDAWLLAEHPPAKARNHEKDHERDRGDSEVMVRATPTFRKSHLVA